MPYPAIGLINNLDPNDFSSEACAFLNYSGFNSGRLQAMDDKDRIFALQKLRDQQQSRGYSMAWPVFAPLCPSLNAFDSTKGAVYNWIKQNGLNGPINTENNYAISESPRQDNVTPFRRNISGPNSPSGNLKLRFGWIILPFILLAYEMELYSS